MPSGAFRASLRNLAPLLAAAIFILLTYTLLTRWATYSNKPAFTIASFLSRKLPKPVKPNSVLRVFDIAWLRCAEDASPRLA
jgi:hypothetical protein